MEASDLDEAQEAAQSLIGKTVTSAAAFSGSGGWGEHLSFRLVFDDGTVAEFLPWGHDAWGCDLEIRKVGE